MIIEHRERDVQKKIGSENNNFVQELAMNTKKIESRAPARQWIQTIKIIIFGEFEHSTK
jgi:hypothetical protein